MNISAPPIRTLVATPDGYATQPWVKWWQALQALINTIAGKAAIFTQAALPSLQATDAGYLAYVSDYNHLLEWNGTKWIWAPGEQGSDYVQPYLNGPTPAVGWHLCDGSTVNRLNSDGTVTAVTLPNLTTASYLKLGTTAAAGPNAAAGQSGSTSGGTPTGTNDLPIFAGAAGNTGTVSAGTPTGTIIQSAATGTDSASVAVQSGSGSTVAAHPHTHGLSNPTFTGDLMPVHQHTFTPAGTVSAPNFTGTALPGHTHGPGTLDLLNTQLKAYYRQ